MIYYNENKNTTVVKILIQINKYNLILQKLHVNQKKQKKKQAINGSWYCYFHIVNFELTGLVHLF